MSDPSFISRIRTEIEATHSKLFLQEEGAARSEAINIVDALATRLEQELGRLGVDGTVELILQWKNDELQRFRDEERRQLEQELTAVRAENAKLKRKYEAHVAHTRTYRYLAKLAIRKPLQTLGLRPGWK